MMRKLIDELNKASKAYYNGKESGMSDAEFDFKLSKLKRLEQELGIVYSDSPTINVGAPVLGKLNEITIDPPMLSLDKCHNAREVVDFSRNKDIVAMTKCDGLSVRLRYENGELVSANTRGNGTVGTDITTHAKQFMNIPLHIPYNAEEVIIDGEAIIKLDDFEAINKRGQFKNPRNTAAGTLNLLDTSLVKERRLSFIAWEVITDYYFEGRESDDFLNHLYFAEYLGFEVVPCMVIIKEAIDDQQIDFINSEIKALSSNLPMDGIVWKYRDVAYGKSLGKTSHHFNNGIAFKFKDETVETQIIDVEWTMGKTGALTPVAIVDPVEIEGTTVEKCSLHNVSIFKQHHLSRGNTVVVYKANSIIPQLLTNLDKDSASSSEELLEVPETCPICGGKTKIMKQNDSEVLFCANDNCKGKLLGKITQYVSKDAMDIDGLSEKTIELLINNNRLVFYTDLYHLKECKSEIVRLPGLGLRSVTKLLAQIEKSRKTTLKRFLISLSIPNVGRTASDLIEKYVMRYKLEDESVVKYFMDNVLNINWTSIEGIGQVINDSLKYYFDENWGMVARLLEELSIQEPEKKRPTGDKLKGKTFVVTGDVHIYKNRKELSAKIESLDGKVTGSVSKNTDYVICNDKSSGSSKMIKANKLGVPIISEEEFEDLIK